MNRSDIPQTNEPLKFWKNSDWTVILYDSRHQLLHPNEIDLVIYDKPKYVFIQNMNSTYLFLLNHNQSGKILASFSCTNFYNTRQWVSPYKAPFGGINAHQKCPSDGIILLLTCVEEFLSTFDTELVTIKSCPSFYHNNNHYLTKNYNLLGYFVEKISVNHHIVVNSEPFNQRIAAQEVRRLTKCKHAGFTTKILPHSSLTPSFHFIQRSRRRMGYGLSLSETEVFRLFNTFPDEFIIMAVMNGQTIIALTIAIRVTKNVLYNFLPADLFDYRTYSPTVMLTEALYDYCYANAIEYLDLGTSLDDRGVFKKSLAKFKENLGGLKSEKVTYVKSQSRGIR